MIRFIRQTVILFSALLLMIAGALLVLRRQPASFAFVTYAQVQEGSFGIYTMWADGSNVRLVNPSGGLSPIWSPRGEWIAYQSVQQSDIYLVRPNGRERRMVISSEQIRWKLRGWSHDGKWLILEANNAGKVQFFRLDVATQMQEPISDIGRVSSPISPDGEWTLFASRGNLYRIRQDGSGRQQLTDSTPPNQINAATWSPLIDLPYRAGGLLLIGLLGVGVPLMLRQKAAHD